MEYIKSFLKSEKSMYRLMLVGFMVWLFSTAQSDPIMPFNYPNFNSRIYKKCE